jgi:hypothetical protein
MFNVLVDRAGCRVSRSVLNSDLWRAKTAIAGAIQLSTKLARDREHPRKIS